MRNQIVLIASFIMVLAMPLGGCKDIFSKHDKIYYWLYKITVEVETPEGVKSGEAVHKAAVYLKERAWSRVNNAADYSVRREVDGEAVVVDLGKRGTLFALISTETLSIFYEAFPAPEGSRTVVDRLDHYIEMDHHKVSLEPGPLPEPKLVTFKEKNNAQSVQLVNPKNLEEHFGEGVKLKGITIEKTKDFPTLGAVDKFLPIGARDLNLSYNYFSWPNSQNE